MTDTQEKKLSPAGADRLVGALIRISLDPRAWYQGDWVCHTTACLAGNIVDAGLGHPSTGLLMRIAEGKCEDCDESTLGHLALDMLGLTDYNVCPDRLPEDDMGSQFYHRVFLHTALPDDYRSSMDGSHGPEHTLRSFEELLKSIEKVTGVDFGTRFDYRANITSAYQQYGQTRKELEP